MRKLPAPDWPNERSRERWRLFGTLHAPFRLLFIAKMLDRSIANALVSESLNVAEWRALAHLALLGESTVSEVASYAHVDRAEVSRAMRSLEGRALVKRADHPDSRAKKLLRLTDEGYSVAERIGASRRAHANYLLDGLDQEQLALFDEILEQLAARIETHDASLQGATRNGTAKDGVEPAGNVERITPRHAPPREPAAPRRAPAARRGG